MTERAKRAAEELKRRGWQIDAIDESGLDKECQQCGYQMRDDSRFCQNCGTRVNTGVADDSLTDIEAAIAAALESP
jgi:RNA polymerase subunit RPABC4/transcription elongation factor Spt4